MNNIDKALKYISENKSDLGLLGSNKSYKQIWARDSMICSYGLLTDDILTKIHRNSLDTLIKNQSEFGKIPHNVGREDILDPALIYYNKFNTTNKNNITIDTAHSGCIDSNLWFIIGLCNYIKTTDDIKYLKENKEAIDKAYLWLQYQDSNECGLLESHEAKDWSDLFSNRYNVLLVNVLWYKVNLAMNELYNMIGLENKYFETAENIKHKINILYWYDEKPKDYQFIIDNRKEWLYPVKRIEVECVERPFFMPYVAFRDYGDRFDSFGNLAAIVYGLATDEQANKILDYIESTGINMPYPVKAVYPTIQPGDKDWREYFYVRNLNLPNQYHNGGIWPFLGSFYVLALLKVGRINEAKIQFEKLDSLVSLGTKDGESFNEWVHGTSGKPMGYNGQSWSCAMYICAKESILNEKVLPWI